MLDTLGQYRLLEQIGAGGAGELYRARDTRVGRTVAVRVLPPGAASSPGERQAFERAAAAALALSHPNIATLYERGEHDGRLFLASEFVPGQTLTSLIAGRPIQPRRAIDLAAQIADALADAHAAGATHGDLSSEAIVVTPRGNAKLLDFGLRRWTAPSSSRAATEGEADGRDIRALGEMLYEMLTGRPPAGVDPVPAARLNRAVAPELDELVMKALAVRGGYEAAATLAAELRAVAAVLDVRAAREPAAPPTPRRRSRSRLMPFAIAAAVIVVSGFVFAWCGAGL